MKRFARRILHTALTLTAMAAGNSLQAECGPTVDPVSQQVDAALAFAQNTSDLVAVLRLVSHSPRLVWDAERLDQAATRFPNVLLLEVDSFSLQRKFNRISTLFLAVRKGVGEELALTGDAELGAALEAVEAGYLDLVLAISDRLPAPSDFSRR